MSKDLGVYYFHQGTNYYAYQLLGSCYSDEETIFRVWAPNAKKVSVVGDFNKWDKEKNPMKLLEDGEIWEAKISSLSEFSNYKYAILTKQNKWILKADPYAYHAEVRPETASKVYNLKGYAFGDKEWMEKRSNCYHTPLNIYELNLGSWRTYQDGNYFNYVKMAEELVKYVHEMGYTHVEIMPISEFPFDKSWGYQVTGYYAITSRFGTPHDFMKFVDILHQANIGVILDWVPGHLCKDSHGLIDFDGSKTYEPSDPTMMEHEGWGTRCFDYDKPEVRSFLISNAMYFLNEYHIDGLRVDAVAAILYLDYDRAEGKWHKNKEGTNINLGALSFLKNLNQVVHDYHKGVMMIAEESTTFPKLTVPVKDGGVGFDYKWNMGWMNDTIEYMKKDPIFRSYLHHKITFQMTYIYSEHYILALSHDEVVHGKCSLLNKMPGTYEQKFAGLKTYLMYMMSHPGKKLNFMGYEFGQFIEWRDDREIDWLLLAYPQHQAMHQFTKKLNHLYLNNKPFYECDDTWDGFEWLNADDVDHNVYVYKRKDKEKNEIYVILNFSFSEWKNYEITIPNGTYEILLASNDVTEGGYANVYNHKLRATKNKMKVNLPAICGMYLRKVKGKK